jgi:hypothetical protein
MLATPGGGATGDDWVGDAWLGDAWVGDDWVVDDWPAVGVGDAPPELASLTLTSGETGSDMRIPPALDRSAAPKG